MANAQYAILRFAKYKGPEISGIEAHNERTKEKYASNPDIDPSRTHLNFHLIKPERKYRAESEKQIAEAGCRTRSDSVRVVEALITATPEFFKGKKRTEIREFFNEALEFIKQNQAPETIISAVVHLDEKSPHMHLCFVPLTDLVDVGGHHAQLTKGTCELEGMGKTRPRDEDVLLDEVGIHTLVHGRYLTGMCDTCDILQIRCVVVKIGNSTLLLGIRNRSVAIVHEVGPNNELICAVGHKAKLELCRLISVVNIHVTLLNGSIEVLVTLGNIVYLQDVANIIPCPLVIREVVDGTQSAVHACLTTARSLQLGNVNANGHIDSILACVVHLAIIREARCESYSCKC